MSSDPSKRRRRIFKPGILARRKSSPNPYQAATAYQLRRIFADAEILKKAASGELTAVVEEEHPAAPEYNQDEGTMSQLLVYYDKSGSAVAEAHQFLKKDGSLGASGQPDPKMVVQGGIQYHLP